MIKYEYKTDLYHEDKCGSLLSCCSKINPVKFSEFLNRHGDLGWEIISVKRDKKCKAFLIVMKRIKNENLKRPAKDKEDKKKK